MPFIRQADSIVRVALWKFWKLKARKVEPEVAENGEEPLDLVDDCLIEICRYLSRQDLFSFAHQAFVGKPENQQTDARPFLASNKSNAVETLHRVFECFGSEQRSE